MLPTGAREHVGTDSDSESGPFNDFGSSNGRSPLRSNFDVEFNRTVTDVRRPHLRLPTDMRVLPSAQRRHPRPHPRLAVGAAALLALLATPPTYAASATATQTPSAPASATATLTPSGTYRPWTISTVAGNGGSGFSGDGGPATSASFFSSGIQALAVDRDGNVLVADSFNHRIRVVAAGTGIISTLVGSGPGGYENGLFSGDGGPATSARLHQVGGVAVDVAGNVVVADSSNHRVRVLSVSTGIITTLAGNGTPGFSGDGGPATSARLHFPGSLAIDGRGNLIIADGMNRRIRMVAVGSGVITTLAGNGAQGYSGDGGPGTSASISYIGHICVDGGGNVYFADRENDRVRKIAVGTGIITTLAGNGTRGFSGDGGPATSASFNLPSGVVMDTRGNVIISDRGNDRLRMVAADTGVVTTVAGSAPPPVGSGLSGFSGDGGPGTSARLSGPSALTLDTRGFVLIADTNNNRVRALSGLEHASTSRSATPSPTPYCQPALFRALPRTDLVGTLVGTALSPGQPVALPSEASCRQACCDAAACDGYSFEASHAALEGRAHCFLYVNITQLVPNSFVASSVRESTLL